LERKVQTVARNGYYRTYVPNRLVEENVFFEMPRETGGVPSFSEVRERLPHPFWAHHDDVIDCYWKTWELAFANLRRATEENGFVANYIDTAFNDCIFMWDSCFIMMFAKYGNHAFSFQRTLDNFYCKQHPDGFICRQISYNDGEDRFHRFDPVSTGPNVMAWAEMEYFELTGDLARLKNVFPVLAAYHRWLRMYRTWPDGSYWSSGWGCGMDNQPRLPQHWPPQADEFYHGHQVWLDTCLQQILSAKLLASMADIVGRSEEAGDFAEEAARLTALVNEAMWDEATAFYYDLRQDRTRHELKTIGAFWALLADAVPEERLERFIAHLDNEAEFKRPHRIPSLSADHPEYEPLGDYWKGGVWSPTNYMVLRGLTRVGGRDRLAHEIALNHLSAVVDVYKETGTIWENYAPERIVRGEPSKPNFVGWSGLAPVAMLFEYVFGLRADVPNGTLLWDVRLLEEHGVDGYPFGGAGFLRLKCHARGSADEKPHIEADGDCPVDLIVRWEGGEERIRVDGRRTGA
jgi:glycogen debranching enzyme